MPKVKEATAKKKKDPNAPKRPLAAYMFFCKETRPKVKEELPESTFGEIGRILGQRWAEADAPTKTVLPKPLSTFVRPLSAFSPRQDAYELR
jgi:hypothetical protein